MKVLSNTLPMEFYLKSRQAEELVVRIVSKDEDHPLKQEFNNWAYSNSSAKSCMFKSLNAHFNGVKGFLEFENVENDFKY